jgi:hypothetical protein
LVAGATSKGIPRNSLMDWVQREIQESSEWKAIEKAARKEATNVVEEDKDEEFHLPADVDDPRTYKEVMSTWYTAQWDVGYDNKISSLKVHNVWTLIPQSSVPASQKVVGSRPHFHTKCKEKGEIYCHKVRVVAKGYSQVQGVDYINTYAPVVRMESMSAILHIGVMLDWEINQLDFKTVFLHGDLKEEVYMEKPE